MVTTFQNLDGQVDGQGVHGLVQACGQVAIIPGQGNLSMDNVQWTRTFICPCGVVLDPAMDKVDKNTMNKEAQQ